jgi:hypothetical protein
MLGQGKRKMYYFINKKFEPVVDSRTGSVEKFDATNEYTEHQLFTEDIKKRARTLSEVGITTESIANILGTLECHVEKWCFVEATTVTVPE